MKRNNQGKSNVISNKRKTRSTTKRDSLVENVLKYSHQQNCREDEKVLRVFKTHSVKTADNKTLQDMITYDEKGLYCYFCYFT